MSILSVLPGKRTLVIGLAASVVLHSLAGALLHVAAPSHEQGQDEPALIVDFDIHEAPEPEQAEMPELDEPEPAPAPEPPPAPEPEAEPEQTEDTPDEPDEIAEVVAMPDAGVPDAGEADALAVAEVDDAGVDAAMVAENQDAGVDAGPALAEVDAGAGQGGAMAGAVAGDAGMLADGGVVVAASQDGAAGQAGQARASSEHTGAGANLLAYFPRGEVVAVLIRFDRLRNTPWARATEAILAPMPDYRSLIGQRDVSLTALFDTLIISTPQPRDVTATTLVGHTRMSGPEVRAFLNHAQAPVAWTTARGGPFGRRLRSRLVHPADRRVFLMPFPGWIVLSQPGHFGALGQPDSGDIDMAMARSADLPRWLSVITSIETESGTPPGGKVVSGDKSVSGDNTASGDKAAPEREPALLLTIAGLLPPVYRAPRIGAITTPQRLTLALEVAPKGFHVRGTMLFASEAHASSFLAVVERARREFVDSRIGKLVLARVNAYNALHGLSLKQNGAKVGFATSISVADARALMAYAARWSQNFFGVAATRPAPATAPARTTPTPKPGSEPSEAGSEPSEPGSEPSEAGSKPSEPGSEPSAAESKPSEPGNKPPAQPAPGAAD